MSDGDDPGGDPDPPAVFAYGTLRPGRRNWAVAAPYCEHHEPATLPGYELYALDHPGVVAVDGEASAERPAPAHTGVRGDLLWLTRDRAVEAIARLDAFEGVVAGDPRRSYYERIRVDVVTAGARRAAWLYVPGAGLLAQVEPARRVPGDDWRT